jgi:hypothetical protein
VALAVISWGVALWVAQAVTGPEIGDRVRVLEERIEQQLRGGAAQPESRPQPPRSHEDASFEPWELVGV